MVLFPCFLRKGPCISIAYQALDAVLPDPREKSLPLLRRAGPVLPPGLPWGLRIPPSLGVLCALAAPLPGRAYQHRPA